MGFHQRRPDHRTMVMILKKQYYRWYMLKYFSLELVQMRTPQYCRVIWRGCQMANQSQVTRLLRKAVSEENKTKLCLYLISLHWDKNIGYILSLENWLLSYTMSAHSLSYSFLKPYSLHDTFDTIRFCISQKTVRKVFLFKQLGSFTF